MDGRDFNLIKCTLFERWLHKGKHRQTPTARSKETKRVGLKTETKTVLVKIKYTTIIQEYIFCYVILRGALAKSKTG